MIAWRYVWHALISKLVSSEVKKRAMSGTPTPPQAYRTIEEARALKMPRTPDDTVAMIKQDYKFVEFGNTSRLGKLKRLFQAVDRLMAEVSPIAVCSKGCAHCCHIDVVIAEIEADYIAKNTGRTKKGGVNRTSGYGETKTPCPHLSAENLCTIYEFRPYHCRTHLAFDDPQFCEQVTVEHVTYSGSHPMLREGGKLLVKLNGQGAIRDIRDFFD